MHKGKHVKAYIYDFILFISHEAPWDATEKWRPPSPPHSPNLVRFHRATGQRAKKNAAAVSTASCSYDPTIAAKAE